MHLIRHLIPNAREVFLLANRLLRFDLRVAERRFRLRHDVGGLVRDPTRALLLERKALGGFRILRGLDDLAIAELYLLVRAGERRVELFDRGELVGGELGDRHGIFFRFGFPREPRISYFTARRLLQMGKGKTFMVGAGPVALNRTSLLLNCSMGRNVSWYGLSILVWIMHLATCMPTHLRT